MGFCRHRSLLCLSAQTSAQANFLWAEAQFPPLSKLMFHGTGKEHTQVVVGRTVPWRTCSQSLVPC